MKPHVFERGDKIFLVNPLAPIELDAGGLEEKAFAAQIKKLAPNENLLWLQGRYVEAERANLNGQQWREGDIVIKSLQPVFMPVTEMHDYRTAVGLIADTKLLTPEAAGVPRARIDTTLAIWAHRFERIAEEIQANYEAGTLMQSMEATAPWYECSECGALFHKLPGGAERAQWCDHLLGNGSNEAARILGGVTFTGTGLIFGSRGSEGAYSEAHLDVFEDEVAEYHERAHRDAGPQQPRRHTSMDKVQISPDEYAELKARPSQEALEAAEQKAQTAEGKLQEAESKLEAAEAEVTKKDGELKEANQKLETAEEESRKAELRDDRLGKLGADFTSKLGETAKRRLREQAGEMTDDDWKARLEELSEMVEVKPEEGEKPKPGEEFSEREVASTAVGSGGGGGGGGGEPSEPARKSTVAKLMG